MGDLIPLADYARGRRVLGAPPAPFITCTECPHRRGCEEAINCLWGAPPDVPLRLVEPPDIIA